jgi:hypothetical protein
LLRSQKPRYNGSRIYEAKKIQEPLHQQVMRLDFSSIIQKVNQEEEEEENGTHHGE